MFFTPELLSRRDSGFGLLWLAATLGSKSVFKKLPKRSVMTADITQLCDLIAAPAEPLALRLSSNLMYGAARVYKVKQEMFIADVNTCVIALKKMVQDMHQYTAADGDLLLAQPIARPNTVTIRRDAGAAHALMIDALLSGWDSDANEGQLVGDDDEDFDPKTKPRKKDKGKPSKPSIMEMARREAHTLNEHHEHLLLNSLEKSNEGSFHSRPEGIDISSSQIDGGFVFEDNFLFAPDGLDLVGGLADELARELGWEINEAQPNALAMDLDVSAASFDVNMYFDGANFNLGPQPATENVFAASTPKQTPRRSSHEGAKENIQASRAASVSSFARALLSQDPAHDDRNRQEITTENLQAPELGKKRKWMRLVLDARTELTDEELKISRAKYLESQKELRKEMEGKRFEKDASKMINNLIWGAPRGITAKPLLRFWQGKFKLQVQARNKIADVTIDREPPKKRTRKGNLPTGSTNAVENGLSPPVMPEPRIFDLDFNVNQDAGMDFWRPDENNTGEAQRGSSEEPGRGRHRSRASSVARGSQFGLEAETRNSFGSQKSMFPWDNAGASSSMGGRNMFSDQIDIGRADIGLRSSSFSRRGSPLVHRNRSASILAGISPAAGTQNSQVFGEHMVEADVCFSVRTVKEYTDGDNWSEPDAVRGTVEESQRSEAALVALEKNSLNFLEYARMQHQVNPSEELKFATVVPSITSTRHVAAAAFYHCLVLATKNLVGLRQQEPYGPIVISIV